MKKEFKLILLLTMGLVLSPFVTADDDESDDDTMTVVDASDNADKIIALPEGAAEAALENAAFGIETANSARELGREFGQQMADSARSGTVSEQVRNGFVEEQREKARSRSRRPGGD